MASTAADRLPRNFILSPEQQMLLYRALASGRPGNLIAPNINSISPSSIHASPNQSSYDMMNNSIVDSEYEFAPEDSLDFDVSGFDDSVKMIGDLPDTAQSNDSDNSKMGSPNQEGPEKSLEKRTRPEGDDDNEEGGGKRRESEPKVPKKPGRKPLTNEPTNKRKAQNRAAQRAFRERKEQHLKDLEAKVEELQSASDVTNSENSQLRAEMEKLKAELAVYQRQLSQPKTAKSADQTGGPLQTPRFFGSGLVNNINDVNFQFDFPKFGNFGSLPATTTSPTNGVKNGSPAASSSVTSPMTQTKPSMNGTNRAKALSSLPSPPNTNDFGYSGSRASLDSTNYSSPNGHNSHSPSASSQSNSNSNGGSNSSCGTSPESYTQSPLTLKPLDPMAAIEEEHNSNSNNIPTQSFGTFGDFDTSDLNFEWLAQQNNGGQFEPQLFSDYREPQDSILPGGALNDTFFNEAFDSDFAIPFNMAPTMNNFKDMSKETPPSLITEIDNRKESDDTITIDKDGRLVTCPKLFKILMDYGIIKLTHDNREQFKNCSKVPNQDFNLDELCADLRKKAKCTGSGPKLAENDFKAVMEKHMGPCNKPEQG